MLPQVEFAYNATRALGIEHSPFEANFGFSPLEPLNKLFGMRPSIPFSQDAFERLKLLHYSHALACTVLKLHKDEIQYRSEPSTAPHFIRGDKVTTVTKVSSYEDSLTVSCVIDSLDLLQLRSILRKKVTYYGCQRQFAYTRCFKLAIYDHALQLRCDLLSQ
jgi:hypothetical protein